MKQPGIQVTWSEELGGVELKVSTKLDGKYYSVKKFYEGESLSHRDWHKEALNLIADEVGLQRGGPNLLNDLLPVFRKVIDLAKRRKIDDKADIELTNYLMSLDYEIITTLQCVMYLGRDEDYDEGDVPEEILKKQREYFDSLGWNDDKSIEVLQMLEKRPLDRYLINGLAILKVNI